MSQPANAAAAATVKHESPTYAVHYRVPGYRINPTDDVLWMQYGCTPLPGEQSIISTDGGIIRVMYVDHNGRVRDIAGATWAEAVEEEDKVMLQVED